MDSVLRRILRPRGSVLYGLFYGVVHNSRADNKVAELLSASAIVRVLDQRLHPFGNLARKRWMGFFMTL